MILSLCIFHQNSFQGLLRTCRHFLEQLRMRKWILSIFHLKGSHDSHDHLPCLKNFQVRRERWRRVRRFMSAALSTSSVRTVKSECTGPGRVAGLGGLCQSPLRDAPPPNTYIPPPPPPPPPPPSPPPPLESDESGWIGNGSSNKCKGKTAPSKAEQAVQSECFLKQQLFTFELFFTGGG